MACLIGNEIIRILTFDKLILLNFIEYACLERTLEPWRQSDWSNWSRGPSAQGPNSICDSTVAHSNVAFFVIGALLIRFYMLSSTSRDVPCACTMLFTRDSTALDLSKDFV